MICARIHLYAVYMSLASQTESVVHFNKVVNVQGECDGDLGTFGTKSSVYKKE